MESLTGPDPTRTIVLYGAGASSSRRPATTRQYQLSAHGLAMRAWSNALNGILEGPQHDACPVCRRSWKPTGIPTLRSV